MKGDLARAGAVLEARRREGPSHPFAPLGAPLHLLETCASTNDEARLAAKEGAPHGATWVAEEQTAGRGRQGRAWLSSPGESLLFSVLLRVSCPPQRLPQLALASGLAVRDAVAHAAPLSEAKIKWPNDVVTLAHGGAPKKLAGILVEATMAGDRASAVVVGIGINVHVARFPEELASRASSIALLCARGAPAPDRAEILADTLLRLERDIALVAAVGLAPIHARLRAADALLGRRVGNDAGDGGCADGIDPEGRLVVVRDDGALARWVAGEVHLVAD